MFGPIEVPEVCLGANILHAPTVKCVHPDTEIFLGDGSLVTISDYIDDIHSKSDVSITADNDLVSEKSHQVVSFHDKMCLSENYLQWKTPAPQELYFIATKTGKEAIVSARHPFLTPKGWVSASSLCQRDRIAIPRNLGIDGERQPLPSIKTKQLEIEAVKIEEIAFRKGRKYSIEDQKEIVRSYLGGKTTTEISKETGIACTYISTILKRYNIPIRWLRQPFRPPKKTSKAFWEWMGYFLSEGYSGDSNGSIRFWFSNSNEGIVSRFCYLTKVLFNLTVKRKKNCKKDMYFDSKEFSVFMTALGLEKFTMSHNKLVPRILFKCSNEEIASFLQAYFDGDGTVAKEGVAITTKSKRLAQDLVYLFQRLGVICFLRPFYTRATNAENSKKQKYWTVSIYGDEVVNFHRFIEPTINYKRIKINKYVKRRLRSKRPSNWDTIPVDPAIFRKVRESLDFSHNTSGKPSSVNSIENGQSLPTRHTMRYFLTLFEKRRNGKFENEISSMKTLSSDEIAWDYVVRIEKRKSDVPYLYDLSVNDSNSFIGNGIILHNTHGHSYMTGALKNAFGMLLRTVRHHAHPVIHEILVDLLLVQKELCKGLYTLTDGTVIGDGAGPRTMIPREGNLLIGSSDLVAADAVQCYLMGINPAKVPKLTIAQKRRLGTADLAKIEITGDFHSIERLPITQTSTGRSPVIYFDRKLRSSILAPLFHTPLFHLPIFASFFYHDVVWYPLIGKGYINEFFANSEWGKLVQSYRSA
jgi:intein/homing endonuclease